MKHIFTYLFIMIIALCSCGSDNKSNASQSQSTTPPITKKTVTSFTHRYFITTADIEGKVEPTRNGKEQVTLKKNTVVKLLNEVSEFRDTVLVNKRQYIEPYEKVIVLTSEVETWIFRGALKSIYTGENDITDAKNLQRFSNIVSNLDPSVLSSGKEVIEKLKALKSTDLTTNDAMFFMGYSFINQLARSSKAHGKIIANHSWTLDDYNAVISGTMDMDYHPVGKLMHENGLALEGALGEILVKSNINVVADALEGKVSKSVQEYIDMLQLSVKSKIFDKDNIIAPLTSLANQAKLWSQFAADYPHFAHISNVTMKSTRLTQALLGGTKSTPAFDHASRTAKPEYKEIWNYVLKHYGDTPLATEVRSHTKWLEGRDWKFPIEKHVH